VSKLLRTMSCLLMLCVVQPGGAAEAEQGDVGALADATNTFALTMYARLCSEGGENMSLAPFSAADALLLLYTGARGQTAKGIAQTLALPLDGERLLRARSALQSALQDAGRGAFHMADSIWMRRGVQLSPGYAAAAADVFKAELHTADFSAAPEAARGAMNGWVAKATRGKIEQIVPRGAIDSQTALVLLNAVHFKAYWQSQFDPEHTAPADFIPADGRAVRVPMMKRKGNYRYARQEQAALLELPYAGARLSMVILLPDAQGLRALEERLDAATLQAWLAALTETEVEVALPRFRLASSFELKPVLSELGMRQAFGGGADFSGMTGGEHELYLSKVLHKVFVEVNEEGTEAAAATGAVLQLKALRITPRFIADRPFLFLIRDNRSGLILFMGRVGRPEA